MNRVVDIASIKLSCRSCSLSELCLPRGLSESELEDLERMMKQGRPIRRGEPLFRVGDPFHSLFAVRSGSIKVHLPTVNGEEQIVGFHLPGELLGLDAMGHEVHTCTAIALETSSVCELPYRQMQDLCHQFTGLNEQFLNLISKEINGEHEMLLMLGKKNAEVRLATFLLNLSARFKARGFSEREFNLSMSRHDIANYLGLAVETVSRLFTRFHEENVLEVQRRLVMIRDLDQLRAIAQISDRNCPAAAK